MSSKTAILLTQMLQGVVNDGTGKSITLKYSIDTAGKTGTSGKSKDKLFVGYTPYYTMGIWSGYENNDRAVNVEPTHLEIWNIIATKIHDYRLNNIDDTCIEGFSVEGLKIMEYCYDSGLKSTNNCDLDPRGSRRYFGYFFEDFEFKNECTTHKLIDYDIYSEGISCGRCPSENTVKISLIDVKDRSFPSDIFISDGEFVYRDINKDIEFNSNYSLPYFYDYYDPDKKPGRSKKTKQFNSGCYIH